MNRTIVKLDALPDPDRPRTQHQHFLSALSLFRLVLSAVNGIIVRRLRLKLRGAGIYHFIGSDNAVFITFFPDLFPGKPGKPCDHVIREFHSLCLPQRFRRKGFALLLEPVLHLRQDRNLIDKPFIHHSDFVDRIVIDSLTDSLRDQEYPLIIHLFHPFLQIFF